MRKQLLYRGLIAGIALLTLVISFQLGALYGVGSNKARLQTLYSQKQLADLSATALKSEIAEIELELTAGQQLTQEQKQSYEDKLSQLEGRVAGLSSELEQTQSSLGSGKYPFIVPTTGSIVTFAGSYAGNMMGIEHWGVDIWTTASNNGVTSGFKGNPVYSACTGKVTKLHPGNGALTVLCDDIPRDQGYDLPAYSGVFIYYGHLGHADTKQQFINVAQNQRVTQGQLLGYQGNLSDVFPAMRNVHLHFTIYSGKYNPPWNKEGGPHNPCIYIGGDCGRKGQRFIAGV